MARRFAVISGPLSGIGAELARHCLDNGFDILICGEEDGLGRAAGRLAGSIGAVHAVRADLATREGVEVVARTIRDAHRPVDALVLNTSSGRITLDGELEAGLELIAMNCSHLVHLVKRIVPELVARGAGCILITTTSDRADEQARDPVVDATRAFAIAFGKTLRSELAGTGVTVTVSSFDAVSSFRAMLAGDELALPRTLTPIEPARPWIPRRP